METLELTQVSIGVRPGPGILISGYDLRDLEELLEQTRRARGSMSIPTGRCFGQCLSGLQEVRSLRRQLRRFVVVLSKCRSFDSFGGAILLTTNCLVEPKQSMRTGCLQPGW